MKRTLKQVLGMDVKEKLSVTSVKGKPRISKQGNKNLRKATYFAALTAVKHNQNPKVLYENSVTTKKTVHAIQTGSKAVLKEQI